MINSAFSIRINKFYFLTLEDSQGLELVFNNDLFQTELEVQGTFSYNINIPALPNSALINFPDILETFRFASPEAYIIDCEIYIEGTFWKDAKLAMISCKNNVISAVLKVTNTVSSLDFNSSIKSLFTSTTITLAREAIDRQWKHTNTVQSTYNIFMAQMGTMAFKRFRCQCNGVNYYSTSTTTLASLVNAAFGSHGMVVVEKFNPGIFSDFIVYTDNPLFISTSFHIEGTQNGLFTSSQISITTVNYSLLDLTQQYMAGWFGLNALSVSICFPELQIDNAYENNASVPGTLAINKYIENGSSFRINTIFETSIRSPYTLVPCVFLKTVLNRLSTVSGISFQGTFINDSSIDNIFIYNNKTLDAGHNISVGGSVFRSLNIFTSTINLADHLPDVTIKTFLNDLKYFFNLIIRFDVAANTYYLDYVDDELEYDVRSDYTNTADVDYEITFPNFTGYVFNQKKDEKDAYSTDQKVVVDGEGTAIDIGVTPCLSRKNGIPLLSMKLDSSIYGPSENVSGLKLFYYIPSTSSPNKQAFSNFEGVNKFGSRVYSRDLTLSSIVATHWNGYLTFLKNAKIVTFSLRFSYPDFLQFNIRNKMLILSNLFLVQQIVVKFTTFGIQKVKATLYQIR